MRVECLLSGNEGVVVNQPEAISRGQPSIMSFGTEK